MAVVRTAIGADEVALFDADKPILIGRNQQTYNSAAAAPEWSTDGDFATQTSTTNTTGGTYPDGVVGRVYDNFDHLQTHPNEIAATWYLLFDFGVASEIDSVVILNHNLNSCSAVVDIQVADTGAGDYSLNLKTLVNDTPADDNRLVYLTLDDVGAGDPYRYSGLRLARIKLTTMAGDVPRIGEVIWGRRRQLKHQSAMPWDKSNLHSSVSRFESASGIVSSYTWHKKRRKISARFTPHEDAYIDDLTTFFEDDLDGGIRPFIYIDEPTTAPTNANWMIYDNPTQVSPLIDYSQREFPIVAMEQGPNFLALES